MNIRTRMAPSPTGEFHIGGIRTFLYNYALAKSNNGQMVLRVEDTDQAREVAGTLERIIDVLQAFGLSWDEGPTREGAEVNEKGAYGPYFQSKRLDIYKEHVQKLLDSGHAYHCFCTSDRLSEMRKQQQKAKLPPKYDRTCLALSKDAVSQKLSDEDAHVIRLKVADNKDICWNDLVLGDVCINSNEIDDQVLIKSDGFPTYHFAVVVDDYLMKISHVLRGMEWVPSTPKQILLYRYFGWDMPYFGHLPNLKEKGSNKKMSKREGDVHAHAFLEAGYLPGALLNFVMFLGWNPGTEKEIYTLDDFVSDFTLEKVHKTDLVAFDRAKLLWMNGCYIRNMEVEDLWKKLVAWGQKFGVDLGIGDASKEKILEVLGVVREKMKLLADFSGLVGYFFEEPTIDRDLLVKFTKDPSGARSSEILANFIELYKTVESDDWTVENLDKVSHESLEKFGYKPKEAFMTLRVALSGVTVTPSLFDVLRVLGKDVALERLKNVKSTFY